METAQVAAVCGFCNSGMRFEEGDVIFGERWFHRECAPKFRLRSLSEKKLEAPRQAR